MKKLLVFLMLTGLSTQAQEQKKYVFTDKELEGIVNTLSELKYKDAAPIVQFILYKVQQQDDSLKRTTREISK